MKKLWFNRLLEAIQDDHRKMREISIAAHCGPNYVQQMIKDGKEPGSDRLARLLDVLGKESALYILTGVRASQDDLEMLRIINRLPDPAKQQAILFFESLQDAEDK